ncbi:unnamed protein product, partial [Effrenium voratum]
AEDTEAVRWAQTVVDKVGGAKLPNLKGAHRQSAPALCLARHFTLRNGHAKDDKGQPATILTDIAAHSDAAILMDMEAAMPYLASEVKCNLPMALLVMGHDCRCQRDDCKRISVPAFDAQQQPVILAVTAHQMSDHRISFAPASIKQVTVEQTIVSAFAIYKDELDEIQWNRMKQ